jgi:hypothetical protein
MDIKALQSTVKKINRESVVTKLLPASVWVSSQSCDDMT